MKKKNQITCLSLSLPHFHTYCWKTLQQSQTFENRINNKTQAGRPPGKLCQQPSPPLKSTNSGRLRSQPQIAFFTPEGPHLIQEKETLTVRSLSAFTKSPTSVSNLFRNQTTLGKLLKGGFSSPSGRARKSLNEGLGSIMGRTRHHLVRFSGRRLIPKTPGTRPESPSARFRAQTGKMKCYDLITT